MAVTVAMDLSPCYVDDRRCKKRIPKTCRPYWRIHKVSMYARLAVADGSARSTANKFSSSFTPEHIRSTSYVSIGP